MKRLTRHARVLVTDGGRATVLRNEGDAAQPDLRPVRSYGHDNPPTREQGTDKPGRSFSSVGARRSSMEPTDWHEIEEQRFAHDVADALVRLVREQEVPALVIAAPPRTLAELRRTLHADVTKLIIAEIDKDLTHQPVYDIEKRLTAAAG